MKLFWQVLGGLLLLLVLGGGWSAITALASQHDDVSVWIAAGCAAVFVAGLAAAIAALVQKLTHKKPEAEK